MKNNTFDSIVIGSGTSAYFCITALNQAGRKVAVIDEREYGGTCALRGCQPKKYLVANAETVAMANHLVGKGIAQPTRTRWEALQALKNEFLDGIPEGEVEEFNNAGIVTFSGRATLIAGNEVEVDGEQLAAKKAACDEFSWNRISKTLRGRKAARGRTEHRCNSDRSRASFLP